VKAQGTVESAVDEGEKVEVQVLFRGQKVVWHKFAVCAHPIDYKYSGDAPAPAGHLGLFALDSWLSDSGELGDLDQCMAQEWVGGYYEDEGSFTSFLAEPSLPAPMSGGGAEDRHTIPLDHVDIPYVDGHRTYFHRVNYRCRRCNQVEVLSQNSVDMHVNQSGGTPENPAWQMVTTLTHSAPGDSVTRTDPLPAP
jgi:hypothetical protein